jgi:hypothetical protein
MRVNDEKLSLTNICQGAAVERFDLVLGEVLANIVDKNTDAEVTREVTLKVKIKPDSDRQILDIDVQAVPKFAPLSPVSTRAVVETDVRGKAEAFEFVAPKQIDLPLASVTPIKKEA